MQATLWQTISDGGLWSPRPDDQRCRVLIPGGYRMCLDGSHRIGWDVTSAARRRRGARCLADCRWRTYQDTVLFARMHLKTGARRVIADEFEGVPGGGALRAVSRVADALDRITLSNRQPEEFRVNLRYCQPLESR
jgi:hypothetical protein